MSQNPDSVANQGEFAGRVKPSEPLQSGGVSILPFWSMSSFGIGSLVQIQLGLSIRSQKSVLRKLSRHHGRVY